MHTYGGEEVVVEAETEMAREGARDGDSVGMHLHTPGSKWETAWKGSEREVGSVCMHMHWGSKGETAGGGEVGGVWAGEGPGRETTGDKGRRPGRGKVWVHTCTCTQQ